MKAKVTSLNTRFPAPPNNQEVAKGRILVEDTKPIHPVAGTPQGGIVCSLEKH